MPAVSQKQQEFFGSMLANPAEAKKKGITPKVAKEFASTPRQGLPKRAPGSMISGK